MFSPRIKKPATITDWLFRMPSDELRRELDDFRIEWERRNNAQVDLSRRYTCQLPREERDWLFINYPDRYHRGLPQFMQEYIQFKLHDAAGRGALDNIDPTYLRLFVDGVIPPPGKSHGHE